MSFGKQKNVREEKRSSMCYVSGLISIIIPVYNVKDYLERCIESVTNQTYSDLEVIIIDDGSDDGSSGICDAWEQRDRRVKVYHRENDGAYSARNMGLEKVRGEFVGFVDSDDYINEDMYAELLQALKEDVDVACCGTAVMRMTDTGGLENTEMYDMPSGKIVLSNQKAVRELLLKRYLSFSTCDKLFRRNLLDETRFSEKRKCSDLLFTYEAIKKSRKVVNIGKIGYFYCYREDSLSRRHFSMDRMNYVLFARDILKDVELCYPQEMKPAEALFFRNVTTIIHEIDQSKSAKQYAAIRKRLKKILKRQYVNIWNNEYLSGRIKKDILGICVGMD